MSLNALKNHLLSGFCPKVVKVPLQAHITDKRVVLCNTTLVYISWIVALVCYVFVFKGWSKKTRVQISYNMWIDPSTEIVQQPANVPYCDNPACEKRESQSLLVSKRNMLNPLTLFFFLFFFSSFFSLRHCFIFLLFFSSRPDDYIYSPAWPYQNITCRSYDVNKVFVKTIAQGTYWVNTMFAEELASISSDGFAKKLKQTKTFVLGVENYTLSLSVRAQIPLFKNFDTSNVKDIPLSMKLPNGTEIVFPAKHRNIGTPGIVLTMTVREWMEYIHGDGSGLDALTEKYDSPTESVGFGRPRICGMTWTLAMKLTNSASPFDATLTEKAVNTGRIRGVLSLSRLYDWRRAVLPVEPTSKAGQLLNRDGYGIQIITADGNSAVNLVDFVSCSFYSFFFFFFIGFVDVFCDFFFLSF